MHSNLHVVLSNTSQRRVQLSRGSQRRGTGSDRGRGGGSGQGVSSTAKRKSTGIVSVRIFSLFGYDIIMIPSVVLVRVSGFSYSLVLVLVANSLVLVVFPLLRLFYYTKIFGASSR